MGAAQKPQIGRQTVPKSRLEKLLDSVLGQPEYESEMTIFMRDFLAQHPEELASQKTGRGAWWDKDAGQRTETALAGNAPKSGGAEYTFKA